MVRKYPRWGIYICWHYYVVFILDGNSELDGHVWSDLDFLYTRVSNVLSYHLIKVLMGITYSQSNKSLRYWVTQKLPQICTAILRIRIGKVA